MENMRRGFLANRDEALQVMIERRAEVTRKISLARSFIQEKKESIKIQSATVNLRGSVGQRIDQGLVELQGLVQSVRDALMGRDPSEVMNFEPALRNEIEAEANKIIKSEFFRALVDQLKKEKDRVA
jgi:hypothetical protein